MSTSINDLPQSDDPANDDNVNENMMVNSILQEIENDEDINNENEDSINYVMDSSQIPPKIDNQIPTQEMIQKASEDIFKNNVINESLNDTHELNNNMFDKEVEKENQEVNNDMKIKTKDLVGNVDNIMSNIINNVKGPVIVFVLFMIISIPQLNTLIIKILPNLATNGSINMLGNALKGLVISIIYFILSLFI